MEHVRRKLLCGALQYTDGLLMPVCRKYVFNISDKVIYVDTRLALLTLEDP